MVLSSALVSDEAEAAPVVASLLRSLARPGGWRFARQLESNIRDVEVYTSEGIYLGAHPIIELEKERFDRVSERIVRGLFYHEMGSPVPAEYVVFNYPQEGGLTRLGASLEGRKFPPLKTVGEGSFSYTFMASVENPNASIWLSFFYGRLPFVGYVLEEKRWLKRLESAS